MTKRVTQILGWYQHQPDGVRRNLQRILETGRLKGTGKMVNLPVDQGAEHGPDASFAPNPDGYDPRYHFQLAVDAGCNAHAAPLGALQMGAEDFHERLALILKANGSEGLSKTGDPYSSLTASVDDAVRLHCAAIGYTIYPGSSYAPQMYETLRGLIAEARSKGLVSIVWAYPRGSGLADKTAETAIDVVSYAAHLACQLGADIVKVKPPTNVIATEKGKKAFEQYQIPIGTLADRIRHVVRCCFAGQRIVIFSGGEAKSDEAIFEEVRAINEGGGFGSIMGRNSFQRPHDEGVKLLNAVQDIYGAGADLEE